MTFLLAVGLLTAVALASGSGFNEYFPEEELAELYKYIRRIALEKNAFQDRIKDLKQQEIALLEKFDEKVISKVNGKDVRQMEQDDRIRAIKQRLTKLASTLSNSEASLAGNIAMASRLESLLDQFIDSRQKLAASMRRQDSLLPKIEAILYTSKDAVDAKLTVDTDKLIAQIKALYHKTQAYADYVNTRRWFTEVVEVDIAEDDGQGIAYARFPEGFFPQGNVPLVACTVQGIVSSINPSKTQRTPGFGYGGFRGYTGYASKRQQLATACVCRAVDDKVEVKTIDQSQGRGNAAKKAYVQTPGYADYRGYGDYASYSDYAGKRRQMAAVSSCRAFTDKVEVTAIDQSQGRGNGAKKVYVQVQGTWIP